MIRLFIVLLVIGLYSPVWSQTKSTKNVSISTKSRLCPNRVGKGDREFSGNGPKVTATARLVLVGKTKIRLTLTLHAKETKKDWTEAKGTWSYDVYTAPSGHKITRILSSTASNATYTDKNHKLDIPRITGGSLVKRFEIMGDTGGNDVGNCTTGDVYMNVQFNTLRVEIQKLEKVITSFGTAATFPKQLTNKMSKSLHGLTHDSRSWFFTQAQSIWKINRSKNISSIGELVGNDVAVANIPDYLLRRGYDRFGDLDAYRGYLFVALSGSGRVAKRPLIAVFKADNMELVKTLNIYQWQKGIGCIAINPSTGFLFSAVLTNAAFLNKYKLTITGDQVTMAASGRFNLLSKLGKQTSLKSAQGAAFSANGRYLFVTDKSTRFNHLRSFNHRTGKEMFASTYIRTSRIQGVTYWSLGSTAPGIRGNLHMLQLHPNSVERDAFTFQHYTIKEGLDWNN